MQEVDDIVVAKASDAIYLVLGNWKVVLVRCATESRMCFPCSLSHMLNEGAAHHQVCVYFNTDLTCILEQENNRVPAC